MSGEIEDREALLERIHEECDGSYWVIYTHAAQQVLRYSDNDDAGIARMGADGFDWSGGIPWSQLAFFAFEDDLHQQLEAEGIDVNADDFGLDDEEE